MQFSGYKCGEKNASIAKRPKGTLRTMGATMNKK